MLDPVHMLNTENADLSPVSSHIVKIIEEIPNVYEPETQMVGPLQAPISLTSNLPKTQGNQINA